MIRINSLGKPFILLTALSICFPNLLVAQQKPDSLDEIIVTATKRSQTLQDIPIAVSVTSGEEIKRAQIQDVADLQSLVPSLRVSQLQSSTNTNFTIRGFGNGANNPGIEPSVGVYIDGVYRSRSAAAISDLPRLERVEVLRGPQSTLFGKNASAGVISVVTAKPSGEQFGEVSVSAGNYGSFVAKGYYEDQISDSAAYSIAASTNKRDGYGRNVVSGADANNRDRQAFRSQLLFNPNESTEIRVIADYDTIDEECCYAVNIVAGPTVPVINALGGSLVPNDAEAFDFFGNKEPINTLDNSGISLQFDKEFSNAQFTSITALRNVDSFSEYDADFTSADLLNQIFDTEIDTFTQEIRLTSTSGDRLDWMIGASYFDESIDYINNLEIPSQLRGYADGLTGGAISFVESIFGLPFGTFYNPAVPVTEVFTLDNQAYSVFGSIDYQVTSQLIATLGLNYTNDKKEASSLQTSEESFSGLDLVALGLPPALAGAQFFRPSQDFPNAVEDGKSDDSEVTYNARLAYNLNDNVNIYAGVSTGFKGTSWNLSRDSRPFPIDFNALAAAGLLEANIIPGTRFASPEEATVYELGMKANWEKGSLNLAIFDQTIEGFQSNAFTGTGFNLANAGKQSTRGIEFDLLYYLTDSFRVSLAGTFLDPIYDSFTGAGRDSITGATVDLSGEKPGGITETALSIGFNYEFALGANQGFLRADYTYEDEIPIGDNTGNPVTDISQFSRDIKNLNLALGMSTTNGITVTVWGRNVTDHTSLISAFPSVGQALSFSGYRTPPRTYGVTLTKSF